MAQQDRNTLKNLFKKGSIPTEAHFSDLVDSVINIKDDGFMKTSREGLKIAPTGNTHKLISFFKNIDSKNIAWSFDLGPDMNDPGFNINDKTGMSRFFIHPEGRVGINTTTPKADLEVNGLLGTRGRLGTYKTGEVPANGKWQEILPQLNGCMAFEIVAQVSKPGKGRHAMLYAIACSSFGNSKPRIHKVQGYYGWFLNKIALRWVGKSRVPGTPANHGYALEMKTRSDYKDNVQIRFHISNLWNNDDYETICSNTINPEAAASQ